MILKKPKVIKINPPFQFELTDDCYDDLVRDVGIMLLNHIIQSNELITYGDLTKKISHGKRCGFSKRYFLVLVACRHLTCTKTECRKMFLSLIAPLTTIRLNRGKRSNRLPYIFAQGQER